MKLLCMKLFTTLTASSSQGVVKNLWYSLPEKALDLVVRIALAILFFAVGTQIIKMIRKVITKSMKRANAEVGAVQFVDSFLKVALYVVLVLMLAGSFGLDATSIVAVIGSAGVAVGLALQGSLSNLAGGVLILVLKPFKVGDYIVEGVTNKEGTVSEISIFYTKLVTPDNKVIVLPNGNLANNTLVNVTAADCRRLDIAVGISYDADVKRAKEALEEVLQKDPKTMKDKDLFVVVDELAESCMKLLLRCWFRNEDFWEGKWRITEECKYALDRVGVEIPYPQIDVHVKDIVTIVDAIEEK